MTGHQIDNFVGSLVEMAKAFEERPELQRRITELEPANEALRESNDILRAHIDDLNRKIAEVTKERDDAGFRCLEADDKAARILDLARTLASGLGQVIAEVEPVKPAESVLVPEGMAWGSGERVADPTPTVATSTEGSTGSASASAMSTENANTGTPTTDASQASFHDAGQSEPGPTVNTGEIQTSAGHDPIMNMNVGSTTTESLPADKPYAGKHYREVPGYIALSDWLAGGGAEVDYWL